jgi:hypothetical protein
MAMDGVEPLIQTPRAPLLAAGAAGLFLHAGWRSCGTWMWERLREHDGVRGFYEPLHEELATLRAQDVGLLRPDSWQSGHGTGAPYFAAFLPLLRSAAGERGKGVNFYESRFAFDRYFAGEDEDDRALEFYVRGLMASAAAEGRLPVMKFCRSLGRVGWMERHFPDVAHAVILRAPEGQWRSARQQMEQNKNRYFVLAPFVILARNASHPLLADAMARLDVKLPPVLGRNLGITTEACWRHVQRLDWQARFRGFLALWVASGVASLRGEAMLIDADLLAGDPAHRGAAEQKLADAAGVPVDLMPDARLAGGRGDGRFAGSVAERDDAGRAHAAALGFLRAHSDRLAPARAAALGRKLGPVGEAAGASGGTQLPGVWDYVDAAAYVAAARATYPLRRAHYHVRRWLKGGS